MRSKWREGDSTKSLENKPGSSFCTVNHRALLFPETSGVLLVFGRGWKESPDPSPQPNHRDSMFSVFKHCEDNGNLLLRSHARSATLSGPNNKWPLQQATTNPCLFQRLLDTPRQVWISLLWGHCSFPLGPGVHRVLFVPSKSLFP